MLYIQTSYLCSTIRKNNMRHLIDIIKKLLLLVLLIVFVVDLQAQETVSLNGQWLMGEGRTATDVGRLDLLSNIADGYYFFEYQVDIR